MNHLIRSLEKIISCGALLRTLRQVGMSKANSG